MRVFSRKLREYVAAHWENANEQKENKLFAVR